MIEFFLPRFPYFLMGALLMLYAVRKLGLSDTDKTKLLKAKILKQEILFLNVKIEKEKNEIKKEILKIDAEYKCKDLADVLHELTM